MIYATEDRARRIADEMTAELTPAEKETGYFVPQPWRNGRAWRVVFVSYAQAVWDGFLGSAEAA